MKFCHAVLLIPAFLALHVASHAQLAVTDSLEQKLASTSGPQRVDLLNRLTYEFISVDNDKVIRYSNEALQLAAALAYTKGEGVAHTYRGVFAYQSGQFPEAHRRLHRGMKLSTEANDRGNIGYALLQLGVCGLEEVDNDSALHYFTKAYEAFKDSSNPESLSKVYRNLSALYGQRFQQDSQQFFLDRAIAIRRLLPDKTLLTDALAVQANNKLRVGDLPGAEKLLAEADEIVRQNPHDLENMHDVKHLRALILFQKGNFEEAGVLFDSARNYYFKSSLFRKYVTLLTDMAKIFSDRGEYELALNNLYEALKLSKRKGFETEILIIRNRIGWINFQLGDLAQALRLANEALNSGSKKQLTGDLANTFTLKGVVLTELGEFSPAASCLDSVWQIYRQAGNVQGMSETLMNQGALRSKMGQLKEALRLYQQSLDLAEKSNYTYGLAWSNWGVADIYLRLGDFSKTARSLDRSEAYARIIHAKEILILDYQTRRDLLAAQGRYKDALSLAILAGKLKDSVKHTDLARRFANMEKMEEIEERDRSIRELENQRQLAEDKLRLQESTLRQQFILLSAGVLIIALLGVLALVYYRFYSRIKLLHDDIAAKNERIEIQSKKLKEANEELGQLYEEVSEQKEEIQSQANELTESNRSITDLNRHLERLVAEKTIELRTTNDELVKHNNELLQFSYTVSHNLRGPVARMLGLAALAGSERNIEQSQQWTSLMGKTASELDLIIKDLSKILELRNEPHQYRELVNLEQEWKQSMNLLQESLTGREDVSYDFRSISELITVRPMLQSIFYNLLSNALKFRSPDRRLTIKASSRVAHGKVTIEIADNGLGFDIAAHKDKVFKLYKRFHSHVEGRGLGLYLIKSQVEVLHGTVDVESTPGVGSVFRITLPLLRDDVLHHT